MRGSSGPSKVFTIASVILGTIIGLRGESLYAGPIFSNPQFDAGYAGPLSFGDLNGDGQVDLVVGNRTFNASVSVLLGNGDGTFAPPIRTEGAYDPIGLVLADLDRDGKLDLAVANHSEGDVAGDVAVLHGRGDGTFELGARFAAGQSPVCMVGADFNGDAFLDLVVLNRGFNIQPENASVLLGNGDGTFAPEVRFAIGPEYDAYSIVAGDFNHDDRLDIAVGITPHPFNEYASVRILLGDGHGAFSTTSTLVVGGSDPFLTAADLDSDGNLDLGVATSYPHTISIVRGDSQGQLSLQDQFAFGDYSTGILSADLDMDGNIDLVAAERTTRNLSVMLGNGSGEFSSGHRVPVSGTPAGGIVSADFNEDGTPDLATIASESLKVSIHHAHRHDLWRHVRLPGA